MTGDITRRYAAQSIIELCRLGLDAETLRCGRRLGYGAPRQLMACGGPPLTRPRCSSREPTRRRSPIEPSPISWRTSSSPMTSTNGPNAAHAVGATLMQATGGAMSRSARYSDIFQPLGFGDEMRVVFRVQEACWGFICLHREGQRSFSSDEARFMKTIAPHVALGLRAGLVTGTIEAADVGRAPGVVLLSPESAVTGWTPPAEQWLEELGYSAGRDAPLPTPLLAVAARLQGQTNSDPQAPRLRVRTRAGRWVVLHASHLPIGAGDAIAVIIDDASPAEVAPIVMLAYGLTEHERTVTGLVCQGLSTTEIAARARISSNTVQDHLKSVFVKVGVRSRRELVVQVLRDHYSPSIKAGRRPGPTGFFA